MQAEESKLELSNEQKQVLYNVVTKIRSGTCERSTIGGFAGTGKTTLIKYLAKFCKEFRVCAYTGKAAEVLRKKEIFSASTIHSLIYRPDYDEDGTLLGFELVPKNEINCEGFIVDEGSMVNFDIYEDLMAYGLPIIFVGDHGQLEPIGTDFNLMKKPDYVLEEIHRNAGEIAHFAEWLRFGKKSTAYHPKSEKVKIISQRRITDDHLLAVDQVICAYNKTRVAYNERIRKALGYTGLLNPGEKIMCLKNNKKAGLFNGMQGIVRNVYENEYGKKMMHFQADDGTMYFDLWYDHKQFGQEKYEINHIGKEYPHPFDYANVVTCHKSQGSEWGKVLVLEQKCNNWDHKRWAYTAGSRAREQLIWAY